MLKVKLVGSMITEDTFTELFIWYKKNTIIKGKTFRIPNQTQKKIPTQLIENIICYIHFQIIDRFQFKRFVLTNIYGFLLN